MFPVLPVRVLAGWLAGWLLARVAAWKFESDLGVNLKKAVRRWNAGQTGAAYPRLASIGDSLAGWMFGSCQHAWSN